MKRSAQLEGEKEKLQDQLEAEKDHSFQMVSKVKAELEKDKLVIALLEDQLQVSQAHFKVEIYLLICSVFLEMWNWTGSLPKIVEGSW